MPPRAHTVLLVTRVGIAAGLIALALFVFDFVRDDHADDALARDDRLCLVEVLIAVNGALHGDQVPDGLPPACQRIVDRGGTPGVPTP